MALRVASDRLERTVLAIGQLNAGAGAALNELPCITLEVGGRGALARRARTRRTVVLALQGNTKAFLLLGGGCRIDLGFGQGPGGGQGRKRGADGAGEDERSHSILGRHGFLLSRLGRLVGRGCIALVRA